MEIEKPPLDTIRLVEQEPPLCRSTFARLFDAINIRTGERCEINCKSWRCEKHREKWGRKWGAIIGKQLQSTPCTLLVNLTTAEWTPHTVIEQAMRRFIKVWRAIYGPTEYIKVTEMNKNHTQPHFHCLFYSPDVVIPEMPKKWLKSQSWPANIWHDICEIWGEALALYAPLLNATTVAWCQPPKTSSGAAAAYYAIGYITGKNKNEEPDEKWQGRKLTASKGFFERPTSEIWAELLRGWFGPAEETRFFWVPKSDLNFDKLIQQESVRYWQDDYLASLVLRKSDLAAFAMFSNIPILAERWKEANFYRSNGHWPTDPTPPSPCPVYEVTLEGQEYFVT